MTLISTWPLGRTSLLGALVLGAASLATAQTISAAEGTVELVDFGVICDIEPDGERHAPFTESGTLNIIDQNRVIDLTTASVPAELGLSFGIRATLAQGMESKDLQVVLTHPPMGNSGIQWQSWDASLTSGDPSINLFTFEKAYELVQGRWVFRLLSDETVLLEQAFEVTPAGTVPAVQQRCFSAQIMS